MPCSIISPDFKTIILSQSLTVDNLWAIINEVTPCDISFIESWTYLSVYVSRADVASSKHIIFVYFNKALAIATLYFSPPDSFSPLSPTVSQYPNYFSRMNWWIDARFAAGIINLIRLSWCLGSSIISWILRLFIPP